MEAKEYIEQLKRHDWYFDFSDDFRVYSAGESNHKRLFNIAKNGGDELKIAYNGQWVKHFYNANFAFPNTPF